MPNTTTKTAGFALRCAVLILGIVLMSALPAPVRAQTSQAQTATSEPLNVLFIAVDDLNTYLGCYGDPVVKSPNIDALAARGMLFSRAYCQQAVCSPSRTSLLTGRYPDTTRIYDLRSHFRTILPDVVTLPQHFKQSGYFTQGIGKIYHGGLDDAPSWNLMAGGKKGPQAGDEDAAAAPAIGRRPGNRPQGIAAGDEAASEPDRTKVPANRKDASWAAPDVLDSALSDGQEADRAVAALGKLQSKPFFLAVGFHKPHLPFIAPKKYFDLYPPASIKLPDNNLPPRDVPEIATWGSLEIKGFADIGGRLPLSPAKARELVRAYSAATSYTDAQIGRVVAELDRLKLRDKTIIVLWGDHGYHMGRNGEWEKHTNFEAAVRVPLIISAPGQTTRGQKTNALVELVDVYPTLCELAGLPLTPGLQGKSLAPLLKNPQQDWKQVAYSQYPRGGNQPPKGLARHMGYTMRTDRYRYTEWLKGDDKSVVARELYDHQTDSGETANIAGRPENAATVAQMGTLLRRGFPALTAPGPLPEQAPPFRAGGNRPVLLQEKP